MSRVTLHVNLSPAEYQAIAKIADGRGVNAHTLIEQLVRRALNPVPKQPEPPQTVAPVLKPMFNAGPRNVRMAKELQVVRQLHAQRWSDAQIANHLGISQKTARYRRIKLNLPPVGQGGRPRKNSIEKERAEV